MAGSTGRKAPAQDVYGMSLTECNRRRVKIAGDPTIVIQQAMIFSKQKKGYQSDITKLINELKEKNPDLELNQSTGRALLWDKAPIDLETERRIKESRVRQQPYVYQTKS